MNTIRQSGDIKPSSETITFEKRLTVERRFPAPFKPKRRRKSPILRKCEGLMEQLWEDGYRQQITWHQLRGYIVELIGGFRTTVTDYLGKRASYYRSRGRIGVVKHPAKRGYLEEFGFIERKTPKLVILHHERVNRGYHRLQTNIVNFSLSLSADSNERIEGAVAPTNTATTTTTYTRRERNLEVDTNVSKTSRLTPAELRILKAATKEGGQ